MDRQITVIEELQQVLGTENGKSSPTKSNNEMEAKAQK